MKKILAVGFLLFLCAAGWEIVGRLSSDAIDLALGVLFGVMAGIPAALIALMASRRSDYQPQPLISQPRYDQQQALMQRNFWPATATRDHLAGAPWPRQMGGHPQCNTREQPGLQRDRWHSLFCRST
ncbi:MAG: hypothetical protein U0175_07060 [Caldilineaceae bacterium]